MTVSSTAEAPVAAATTAAPPPPAGRKNTAVKDGNIDGNDLGALVQAGSDALAEGDLRTALETFERVIDAFPDQPEGHNNLGALYSSLGDLTRAEACFTRVVELVPDNPHVLYNRGVVRSRNEDYAGARDDFQAALKLAPSDADIHNNLGVADFLLGRHAPARRHFERALQLRPDYDNALLNLCDLVAAAGDLSEAVDICRGHLAQHASAQVRRRLFELLGQMGRRILSQAAGEAEALLAARPEDHDVRQELGRIMQASNVLGAHPSEAEAAG